MGYKRIVQPNYPEKGGTVSSLTDTSVAKQEGSTTTTESHGLVAREVGEPLDTVGFYDLKDYAEHDYTGRWDPSDLMTLWQTLVALADTKLVVFYEGRLVDRSSDSYRHNVKDCRFYLASLRLLAEAREAEGQDLTESERTLFLGWVKSLG
jgi:hypothetical protein